MKFMLTFTMKPEVHRAPSVETTSALSGVSGVQALPNPCTPMA
jgi:hypothetical protein